MSDSTALVQLELLPEVQKGMYYKQLKGLRVDPDQESCIKNLQKKVRELIDASWQEQSAIETQTGDSLLTS